MDDHNRKHHSAPNVDPFDGDIDYGVIARVAPSITFFHAVRTRSTGTCRPGSKSSIGVNGIHYGRHQNLRSLISAHYRWLRKWGDRQSGPRLSMFRPSIRRGMVSSRKWSAAVI